MGMTIAEIPLTGGVLGICPLPGRDGDYAGDLASVLDWHPTLVLSLTEHWEAARRGAAGLGADLMAAGVTTRAFPIPDFGTPGRVARRHWQDLAAELHGALEAGGRVLVHCLGGCGRSGMIALRLMREAGEEGEAALSRLRLARPCAVETKAQYRWALLPPQE